MATYHTNEAIPFKANPSFPIAAFNGPYTYLWEFDDGGGTATGQYTTHIYPTIGTKTTRVTAFNGSTLDSATASIVDTIIYPLVQSPFDMWQGIDFGNSYKDVNGNLNGGPSYGDAGFYVLDISGNYLQYYNHGIIGFSGYCSYAWQGYAGYRLRIVSTVVNGNITYRLPDQSTNNPAGAVPMIEDGWIHQDGSAVTSAEFKSIISNIVKIGFTGFPYGSTGIAYSIYINGA